jgi:hypothetical protein
VRSSHPFQTAKKPHSDKRTSQDLATGYSVREPCILHLCGTSATSLITIESPLGQFGIPLFGRMLISVNNISGTGMATVEVDASSDLS